VLERLAVRESGILPGSAALGELEKVFEKGKRAVDARDAERWIELDAELHVFFAEHSENEVLRAVLSTMWDRI
jgi:DNA-binding GntR family transcriptional regulator